MSRLPRPPIPLETKCRVAMRQLGELWPQAGLDQWLYDRTVAPQFRHPGFGKLLESLVVRIAALLGCEVSELRLDHDPALENREKLVELPNGSRRRVVVLAHGMRVLRYFPDANDPEHLFYRPHGAQFAGSHDVKTRLRGDNGQLSDNMLAKKNRNITKRRARRAAGKASGFPTRPKYKWPSRLWPKRAKKHL